MEKLNDNDILLYLDCGCEIDIKKREKIAEYFELVKEDIIIGTNTICSDTDKKWTKMDLVLELDMLDDNYLNTSQHQTGAILFLVCDKTRDLVNKWYELSCNYHNIDDTPSVKPNDSSFI